MAHGLLADSSMKIVFRQAPGELAAATEMLGLPTPSRPASPA